MKRTIKGDCTHAYAGRLVLLVIFMALFTAVMHGQELPTAPQIAVKHQSPPLHKQEPLLAKLSNPVLGSAGWFRERGLFKLAKFIPVLTHIDWNPSYDKPKEPGRGSRKAR